MTLVLRLARPDSLLLDKLALPGVSAAWKQRDVGGWLARPGLGPYVAVRGEARRLVVALAKAPAQGASAPGPDTVIVRFGIGAGRIRSILRESTADLVWPVPPGLPDEPLPAGYRWLSRPAVPHRRLLMVMRADTPPTTKLAARHVLAHGLNRDDLLRALGTLASETGAWLPGAGRFEFPALDPNAVRLWLDRGNLGRSFHIVLAYDTDGSGDHRPLARTPGRSPGAARPARGRPRCGGDAAARTGGRIVPHRVAHAGIRPMDSRRSRCSAARSVDRPASPRRGTRCAADRRAAVAVGRARG
jgi:hypothetical protein